MKRFILLTLTIIFSRASGDNFCNIKNGNLLHLICNPSDTRPIHEIKDDSVSCAGVADSRTLRENIEAIDIATCSFDDFSSFHNFTTLRFSFFHDTKSIRKETFIEMNQLTYFKIGYSNAEVVDSAFSGLPNLRKVDIYSNNLSLKRLAFQGAHQLKSLVLSDFSMSSLPIGFFRDLNNLEDLSFGPSQLTNLSAIDFTGLENVKWLNLGLNRISNMTGNLYAIMTNIKYLILGNNRIVDIDSTSFCGLHDLIHLDLQGNQITKLNVSTFSGLINLRSLNLYNNYIRSIEDGAFLTLKNLRALDLSNNRLTALDEHNFDGLVSLQYLSLMDNLISAVNIDTFTTSSKLIQLDMSNQHGQMDSIDLNAFPQFIDLETKTLIPAPATSEPDDFEKKELQWITDILSLDKDFNGDIRYYQWKFFGNFWWNRNNNYQVDFNNLSQNMSSATLIFGNLNLSKNQLNSVNIKKRQ